MDNNEEYESPYCKLCENCGIDGCCSYINCFRNLIKNSDCDYGNTYLKDAIFDRLLIKKTMELIDDLKEKKIDSEQFLAKFDIEWSNIYDQTYKIND